ncbi:MAG: flotillin family protein [Armatimonadetes bacterium]|nr:flotillin family protein [Armatimonadota bacterium]
MFGDLTLVFLVVGAIALVGVLALISRLYRRSTSELAFVRTGQGGLKVVMNRGSLVIPVLHDLIWVNMNTLRLEVMRSKEEALITKDRLRVDVRAEFYVRVAPNAGAISNAASTLGQKTLKPLELKELVEGKFVDALRAVAAEMTMEELHEQRSDFVQRVQTAVTGDLLKNGLELETVSLTSLDQTSRDFFNPNNAFDAQGLTKLTEEIEVRRQQRNAIEQDTQVQIARKNLDAQQHQLQIQREVQYAQLEQEREVSIRTSEQATEIALQRASKEREQKEGEIAAKLIVDAANIESQRAVQEKNIEAQRILKERDIARGKAIELAEQDKAIAIAERSKAQSEAQAQADIARALAAKAEEQVATARATEIAERQKQIDLVEAQKEAQREAIGITVAAEAEKTAAQDRAEALKIGAMGEAEAEKLRVQAAAARYAVDAEGQRAVNEAANMMSPANIEMQIKMALMKAMPDIIRESVKPMENIDGIKILQVNGLGGDGATGAGHGNGSGNLAEEVVSNALRYRAQAPILDSLLAEIGLSGGDLNALTQGAAMPKSTPQTNGQSSASQS